MNEKDRVPARDTRGSRPRKQTGERYEVRAIGKLLSQGSWTETVQMLRHLFTIEGHIVLTVERLR